MIRYFTVINSSSDPKINTALELQRPNTKSHIHPGHIVFLTFQICFETNQLVYIFSEKS